MNRVNLLDFDQAGLVEGLEVLGHTKRLLEGVGAGNLEAEVQLVDDPLVRAGGVDRGEHGNRLAGDGRFATRTGRGVDGVLELGAHRTVVCRARDDDRVGCGDGCPEVSNGLSQFTGSVAVL